MKHVAVAAAPAATRRRSGEGLRRVPVLTFVVAASGLVTVPLQAPSAQSPPASPQVAPTPCTGTPDPYANYACLDPYLGENPVARLFNYYKLEIGQSGPPVDPNAPPGRRANLPDAPVATPPMPFTEWPYGGVTAMGVTRTASVDSPLMAAISNTTVGRWLGDSGIQIYGWVDAGGNISTSSRKPGGNAPIADAYTPNTVQLDQTVIYIERLPDTVQQDHIDWGFRLSALYGENYRYTTTYGIASYQYLKYNSVNGYDFPMLYGELYIPGVADGLMLRFGRYVTLPDIEAQLAPNDYTYTRSLTYAYDNYTNEGLLGTLMLNKNVILQLGVTFGTETAITNLGKSIPNPNPNPLYPGTSFSKDPGAQPSGTACVRINWNDGKDTVYPCASSINHGTWGYNNLQWYGFTYYHKFNDHWHISYEFYDEHQNGVPNVNNPAIASGIFITPFSSLNPATSPQLAHCSSSTLIRCNAYAIGSLAYINYSPDGLNNISFRPEIYYDPQGQRTGTAATYYEFTVGWQHWLSPQIEVRPEVGYYRSNGANAFNGRTRNYTFLVASDMILHF